jgi:CHAT domain-containing protein
MKKAILVLVFLVFSWSVNLIGSSHAQPQRGEKFPLWKEAMQVWRGEYSPGDLAKWEKRLKKLESNRKWPGVALCHNVIGVIYRQEGNLEEGLRHLGQSLQITRENGLEKLTARNLLFIGGIQWDQGRGDEGFKSVRECVEIAQRTGMTGVAGHGVHLLSAISRSKGRYREAMGYAEQALQMAKDQGNDQLMMVCLYDVGQIHRFQGNSEKARDHFARSLDLAKGLKNRKWMAFNFAELGDMCSRQKDYRCAVENYRQSTDLFESLNDKQGLAITYNKIGKTFLFMRNVKSAVGCFEKSHEIAKEIGMKSLIALTSLNMGKALNRMGRPEEALARTDEAIALYKRVEAPDALRECYFMKGALLERKGDISGAENHYAESVKILETLREDVAGGEEEMVAFVEIRGHAYQRLIALLLKQGKIAEALEYLERSRLRNLRDQFDQLAPRLGDEREEKAKAKEKKLREEIEAARTQLVEEKSKPKEVQDVAKITQLETNLNEKRQQYIEYINDLREKFPELASLLAIQPDSLIDLQSLLPPQVAIIQYLILEEGLYLFVVTRESVSYREVKVSQSDLEAKIDYFRSLLMNPQIPLNLGPLEAKTLRPKDQGRSDAYEMFIRPFLKASQELYQFLIKPVEGELSRTQVLGIIPNGKLHLLPFQALGETNPQGEFRFLLEGKSIFYLNSQSILKFAQKRAKEIGNKGTLIAFGNPDDSLRHAEEEIDLIRRIFAQAKVYVRRDATEDKVKAGLAGFNILHFATHGKMKGNIKDSYVLLAPSSDGKEDGKLFLREIWGLPLLGYQLVTLSACETAMGKEASGDVMVSLETAFLRAGTPTILASLWAVDDEATGTLMNIFYDHVTKGGKAEALRRAQVALLSDPRYVYPYYWAPFILVGDWQ